MRILALPRDPNPYQSLLYPELERLGASVRYLGELTPSRTLNLLLLPLELAVRRASGWRLVHLHWVFAFALPGARRVPVLRRASQAWFALWLATARVLRVRIVWTAHNALPHERVFQNDVAARQALVRSSDLVIAHSGATLESLEALGARPARWEIVPIGPSRRDEEPAAAVPPRAPDGTTRLLFVGRILAYKGVEDLLAALCDVPADAHVALDVVGECPDPALRRRLAELAAASPHPVSLSLSHVAKERLDALLAGADAVVLPFRSVTTSSSAVLALDHGRPLIVPDLPGLRDLPEDAVIRYDGTPERLAEAIRRLAGTDGRGRAELCGAARSHAPPSWAEIAARTLEAIRSIHEPVPLSRTTPDAATGAGGPS
jgi:glycosyltransferase involved in cell wall biosynthesis